MSAELAHIASKVFNTPWAILPATFESICEVVHRRMQGIRLTDEQVRAEIGAERQRTVAPPTGGIALLPVTGVIGYRASLVEDSSSGVGTSVELLGRWFDRAAGDPNITAIVFDVDSPGGSVEGLTELSQKIFQARGAKPTIAVANGMAASAAYYIASSADKLVVTPSGMVGSIGTVMSHVDASKFMENKGLKETFIFAGKYKVEGNPLEPLQDEARAEFQRVVDAYYEQFVGDVARNRGISSARVKSDYGQGRMLLADEALRAGMVDQISSLDDVLISLGAKQPAPGSVKSELDNGYDIEMRKKNERLRERRRAIQKNFP